MANDPKTTQMIHIAELYYEQNLSQQEIAKILGCSHSTISRSLSEAREKGLIRFKIHRPVASVPELSIQLRELFGLRDAIVVPDGKTDESTLRSVGIAAAQFVSSIIDHHATVGVTWGQTISYMLDSMDPIPLEGVEVYQLTGSLGQGDPSVDGPKIAIRLSELLNGHCYLAPVPAVVDDEDLRNKLMAQKQVSRILEKASHADIMIQGIGSIQSSISSLVRAGYLSKDDAQAAMNDGAVGHMFARMINKDGKEVGEYSKRVLGIPLEAMRNAKWAIGISASIAKAPAVLAALRGHYINAVVIEEGSAREVIRLFKES